MKRLRAVYKLLVVMSVVYNGPLPKIYQNLRLSALVGCKFNGHLLSRKNGKSIKWTIKIFF